jgi:serine/threonine protein kinase
MQDPLIGLTLGSCRLEALLGKGGMGSVYRARHLKLDRPVAIKLLAPHLESDPEYVERFLCEAKAAAAIDHPNVVHVLDVGEEDHQHFIVLQFVDGENLEDLLEREGRVGTARAVAITRQVAAGLSALHAANIVHRDIKPGNILLGRDGSVRITDFGLARNLRLRDRMTVAGVFMGTPEYVAPEQVKGPAVDARTDLYSLGICFYRMLSGELPFEALSAMEMASKQLKDEPVSLLTRVPDADPRVWALIRRLLDKEPARRYGSAQELIQALEALDGGAGDAPASKAVPVPEIQVKGRRIPPGSEAPAPATRIDPTPEISAGPKKRVIQGGPVVPREIVPIPPPPPKRPMPETLPPPPPPPPIQIPEPRPPKPTAPPAAKPAPAKRPKASRSAGVVWLFWPLVAASGGLLYAAGVLGASFRAEGFWEGLPRPFYRDPGLGLRLALGGGALASWALAFWFNRKELMRATFAGPGLMLPLLGSFCLYAAGYSSEASEGDGSLVLRAFQSTLLSLAHPVLLGPAGVWLLLAGLAWGRGAGGFLGRAAAGLLVVAGLAGLRAFALGDDVVTALGRYAGPDALPASGALAAAALGCWLDFGGVSVGRKTAGILLVLAAAASMLVPGTDWARAGGLLVDHGIAFFLGIFLLFWGGWFLHGKTGGR